MPRDAAAIWLHAEQLALEVELIRLVLLNDGHPPSVYVLDRLTNVGRGPGNHLVIDDRGVSWNHGTVWLEGTTAWIRDLNSTNGTFVNDRQIKSPEPFRVGDRIRFGTSREMSVEGDVTSEAYRDVVVEDLATRVRVPIRTDRFTFGEEGSDILVPGQPFITTLVVHPTGEIWLGVDDDDRPLAVGEAFTVGDREFAIREVGVAYASTIAINPERYPYRLVVALDGSTGPVATLLDLKTGIEHKFDAENRAVLLWLLGQRRKADLEAGKPDSDAGWCTDIEIQSGIWGRQGDANKMHVLIHRVRAEIKKAGLDPWLIEKRYHYVRARVQQVDP